jgi:outer membrane protein OmpA-like peptidoglycan-associated protein
MTHRAASQVLQPPVSRPALAALALAVTAVFVATVPALAQDPSTQPLPEQQRAPIPAQPTVRWAPGQEGKVKGAIMTREGDEMLVRQESSNDISTVTLTENTKISSPSGFLNIDHKKQDVSLLAPGLFVEIHGIGGDHGNLVATRVTFSKRAVKVQNSVAAGEVDLREKQAENAAATQRNLNMINAATRRARDSIAAMTDRIANLDKYVVKEEGTVYFASGSFELNEASKQVIDNLAARGQGLQGFMVEVAGFTDNVGDVALNQALSARRVNSVVAYAAERFNIPLRRFVNPTGLGETQPVGDNNTSEGRALNRRVEIRVLQNQGIAEADSSARKR